MVNTPEDIYDATYLEERRVMQERFNETYEQARDKEHAVKMLLAMYFLPYAFHKSCKLTVQVLDTVDSAYKLGMTMQKTIESFPHTIDFYKREEEHFRRTHDTSIVKVNWKKFWGIPIPVGPKIVLNADKNPYIMAGPFAMKTDLAEIATELGKVKALFDFFEFLKVKFKEIGGTSENLGDLEATHEDRSDKIKQALAVKDLDAFFKVVKSQFASVPYFLNRTEASYHNVMHTMLGMVGSAASEIPTNIGRIDTIYKTERYVYLFEFKLDCSDAMDQIIDRKYYEQFLDGKREIILVAVRFSSKLKNVEQFQSITLKN